jgi:hypothetical protein
MAEGWGVEEFEDGAGRAGGTEVKGLGRHDVAMVVRGEAGRGLIMCPFPLTSPALSIGGRRDFDLG